MSRFIITDVLIYPQNNFLILEGNSLYWIVFRGKLTDFNLELDWNNKYSTIKWEKSKELYWMWAVSKGAPHVLLKFPLLWLWF